MNLLWPSSTDYMDTIQNPRFCFNDPDLVNGTVETTALGLPKVISGGFANVYRIKTATKDWAVRCFLKEIPDQQQRYEAISKHLRSANLPYTVGFQYLKQGIKVKGEWFPVLKMEWIEGESLTEFLGRNLQKPDKIQMLSEKWKSMVEALRKNNISHGDLQHGNVLIHNNDFKLIDYDAMFVPQLQGKYSNEIGHRNYQHPKRSEQDFGLYTDNFSALVIYCTFVILSIDSELWKKVGAGDEYIFFKKEDFDSPRLSDTLYLLKGHNNNYLNNIATLIEKTLAQDLQQITALDSFNLQITNNTAPPLKQASSWLSSHISENSTSANHSLCSDDISRGTWVLDHIENTHVSNTKLTFQSVKECRMFLIAATASIGAIPYLQLSTYLHLTGLGSVFSEILVCNFLILYFFYDKNPLVEQRRKIESEYTFENKVSQTFLSEAKKLDQAITKINNTQKQEIILLEKAKAKFQLEEKERLDKAQSNHLGQVNSCKLYVQRLTSDESNELSAIRSKYAQQFRTLNSSLDTLKAQEDTALRNELDRLVTQFKDDYLKSYTLANASIPGIGPAFKTRLLAAGFTTAADISYHKVQRVSGIGESRAADLFHWRHTLESRISLPKSLSQSQSQTVKSSYSLKRNSIESNLAALRRQQPIDEQHARNRFVSLKATQDKVIIDAQASLKSLTQNIKNEYKKKQDALTIQIASVTDAKEKERQALIQKRIEKLGYSKESNWKAEKLKRDIKNLEQFSFKSFVYTALFNKEVS